MLSIRQIDWPRCFCWLRTVLAAAALAGVYFYIPHPPLLLFALLVLFLVFSVVLAVRGKWQTGTLALLALFGDTVFFLVVASYGTERLLWVASAFLLYLLTEAVAFHEPVEVVVVTAVSVLFCILLPYGAISMLQRPVLVAGLLACGFTVTKRRLVTQTRDLTVKLAEARKTAEKAQEVERQRIASDFHDGPLQSFISLQMRLEILRKLLERDVNAGMNDLQQLQALAQSQIRDLRVFLHSMRPVDVDGANLVASARRTADMFQKESGIPVTFVGANTPVGLPPEMSGDVLQMLREALHNVQKHAGATRVAVAMEKTDRGIEISIDDNGHGFNFAGTYSLEELELLRLGPASLKRRARSLNADLLLESRPGRGAGLKFRIPLQ
ncbi:MAG TPA: histidine kinase [Bryobacteraceae bacterium]|nr:histidine kinase [Bryobacteraceae bacterium]